MGSSRKYSKIFQYIGYFFILSYSFYLSIPYLLLNDKSINVLEVVTGGDLCDSCGSETLFVNNNTSNHIIWLDTILSYKLYGWNDNHQQYQYFIKKSHLYTSFVSVIAHTNLDLANFAVINYPDLPNVLIWKANIIEIDNPYEAEIIYKKLLEINPKDEISWYKLGMLYWRNDRLSESLEVFKTSCLNRLLPNNTCYFAGLLLVDEKKYESAIYYLEKSSWQKAKEEINLVNDLLISSQNN